MNFSSGKLLTARLGSIAYLFAVLTSLAAQFLFAVIILSAQKAAGIDLAGNAIFNFALMAVLQLGFFGVFYFTVIRPRYGVSVLTFNRRDMLPLALAPLLALCCLLAFYAPTLWFAVLLDKAGFSASGVDMVAPFDFVLGCFVYVIAAPFCEELIFRGALLSGLRKKFKPVTAVLLSALAFSLMHMNPAQTVYQFFLGAAAAVLCLYSGSILPPMLLHASSNALALIIEYTPLRAPVEGALSYAESNVGAAVGLSLAFTAVFCAALAGLLLLIKKRKRAVISGGLGLQNMPLTARPAVAAPLYTTDAKAESIGGEIYAANDKAAGASGEIYADADAEKNSGSSADLRGEIYADSDAEAASETPVGGLSGKTPKRPGGITNGETFAFWVAAAICVFMWITVFIGGLNAGT
ncbi:MAG: CPBP family intramembrane metalloprotease [Clostridiales bacterium]|jgi:membrane protease YdiL (CAAX protease family)|nr:CPBP family intramembrane metalloprotease [Clostridiales bacterium]